MKAIATITKFIADPLAAIRNAGAQVRAAEAQKRQERDRERAGRQQLTHALAPKPDVESNLEPEVPERGEAWAAEHGRAIIESLGGRVAVDATGTVTGTSYRPRSLADAVGPITFDALCALAPDLVRAGLRRIIERTEYEAGPPMGERQKLIAAADARITALEAEHAALVAAAAESGIQLPELDENRARRLRTERERQAVADHNRVNAAAIAKGRLPAARTLEDAR